MSSSYDFVTPRIPPAWALSWTAHLRNKNCQLSPYDIVGFATLEIVGNPVQASVTTARFKSSVALTPNVTIQWVGGNKAPFGSPTTPVLGETLQVDTQIPLDGKGTFFAAVSPDYDLADLDHRGIIAGPPVVLIK